jgi:hypothetical protein
MYSFTRHLHCLTQIVQPKVYTRPRTVRHYHAEHLMLPALLMIGQHPTRHVLHRGWLTGPHIWRPLTYSITAVTSPPFNQSAVLNALPTPIMTSFGACSCRDSETLHRLHGSRADKMVGLVMKPWHLSQPTINQCPTFVITAST